MYSDPGTRNGGKSRCHCRPLRCRRRCPCRCRRCRCGLLQLLQHERPMPSLGCVGVVGLRVVDLAPLPVERRSTSSTLLLSSTLPAVLSILWSTAAAASSRAPRLRLFRAVSRKVA